MKLCVCWPFVVECLKKSDKFNHVEVATNPSAACWKYSSHGVLATNLPMHPDSKNTCCWLLRMPQEYSLPFDR